MRSARAAPAACGRMRVLVAVDDEHGAAHARTRRRKLSCRHAVSPRRCRRSPSAVGLEAPPDAVLDLLGRVRLVEHACEEELDEVARSRCSQYVALYFAQPSVVVDRGPRTGDSGGRHGAGASGTAGPMATRPGHALGVVGGELHRRWRAAGQPDEDGGLGAGGVEARPRCRRRTRGGCRPRRPPGTQNDRIATAVERDDAVAAGQRRLPAASRTGRQDRPRRQQRDRRRRPSPNTSQLQAARRRARRGRAASRLRGPSSTPLLELTNDQRRPGAGRRGSAAAWRSKPSSSSASRADEGVADERGRPRPA